MTLLLLLLLLLFYFVVANHMISCFYENSTSLEYQQHSPNQSQLAKCQRECLENGRDHEFLPVVMGAGDSKRIPRPNDPDAMNRGLPTGIDNMRNKKEHAHLLPFHYHPQKTITPIHGFTLSYSSLFVGLP
jgi:hypothetical protein